MNIKITKKMSLILTLVVVSSILFMVIRDSRELSLYEAYAEEMCSHIFIGDSYENVQNIINKNLKNSESENLYKRSDQKIISVIYTLDRWFKPRYVCTVVFNERVVTDKFTKFLD